LRGAFNAIAQRRVFWQERNIFTMPESSLETCFQESPKIKAQVEIPSEPPVAMDVPELEAPHLEDVKSPRSEPEVVTGTAQPETDISEHMQSTETPNPKPEPATAKSPEPKRSENGSEGRPIDQQEAEVEEALARMQTDNDNEEEREAKREQRSQREQARAMDRGKDANNMVNRVKGAEVFVGGLQRMTTEEDLREVGFDT
jgi:hypothetical protein